MSADRSIRSIAIAGGGIVGLSAAISFARALRGTRVTLVDLAPEPAAIVDIIPTTWPGVTRFHSVIGLAEVELVRSGIATHHLGSIFEGWSASGALWAHAFGPYGKPAGAIPFDQVWCRARELGDALAYDRYSMGAALAREGKFVHPATDPNSIGSRFQYALRLDPDPYRDALRERADMSGVTRIRAEVAEIELADGAIGALQLADGSRLEADLFIDCTGPSGRLISAIDESFEDWSEWMPFDRLSIRFEPNDTIPGTCDRVSAIDEGWRLEWPIKGRSLGAELRIAGDGIAITRGRRLRPWVRNVLALGDAAAALDPLHGMSLEVAQQSILLALELLPDRAFPAVETQEYNRRAEQLTRRVRDFLALHYLRSGRTGGAWGKVAQSDPPDSLARTLDQYQYRARLPFFEEEFVTRDSWTAALLGMGVLPTQVDPQAAEVQLDKAVTAMARLAREIDETVARLPSYGDYLAGTFALD